MDIEGKMDKSQGMTWTTFPRANFGLFLVKGTGTSGMVLTISQFSLTLNFLAVSQSLGEIFAK